MANDEGGYDVLPSGDTSGATDRKSIQCALDHTSAGGVTILAGSDFYIDYGLSTRDFEGRLRGLGRDVTTLHLLGFDTYGVLFRYSDDFPGGALAVSDFTMVADANLWYGVLVINDVWESGPVLDVDVTFEHLGAIGGPGPLWGSTLAFPFLPDIITDGTIRLQDIYADGTATVVWAGNTDGADVLVGGSEADAIIGRRIVFYGVLMEAMKNTSVEISHVDLEDARTGVEWVSGFGGNDVTVTDNHLQGVRWYGIAGGARGTASFDVSRNVITGGGTADGIGIEDWAAASGHPPVVDAVVSDNLIDLDTNWGGIYDMGVQGMQILNNVIQGTLMAGIYVSPWGEPVKGAVLDANDVQNVEIGGSGVSYIHAPIYLGQGTDQCLVVGGHGEKVMDDTYQDQPITDIIRGYNLQLLHTPDLENAGKHDLEALDAGPPGLP